MATLCEHCLSPIVPTDRPCECMGAVRARRSLKHDGNRDTGAWIQTFTGRAFWPLDPDPEQIAIEDIAHALSLQNRYAGHTFFPYSVARHSLCVMRLLQMWGAPELVQLLGLLHDASEAYLTDIPAPLKNTSLFDGYGDAERRLQTVIERKFMPCAFTPGHPRVKEADYEMLLAERPIVLPPGAWKLARPAESRAQEAFNWGVEQFDTVRIAGDHSGPIPAGESRARLAVEKRFLAEYERLTKGCS